MMGSVIDYIECPNCKTEAMSDFYYKTGEEYINCGNCGYHYSATIKNRDKKLNELTEDDWEIKELKHPYAAYRIKPKGSFANEMGTILDLEHYHTLIEMVMENEHKIEECTISRLFEGKIVEEKIINK